MVQYKLTYFNTKGRAEISRLLFTMAGVEYEDERITKEDWKDRKAGTLWGTLPQLEVDGKVLGQSLAIARYLASTFGFAGKDDIEKAFVDGVVDALQDIANAGYTAHCEKDETAKEKMMTKFTKETLPAGLGHFEKMLVANGGGDGYMVGDSVTWADLGIYEMMSFYLTFPGLENALEAHPKIRALVQKIGEVDKIKAWVEKRPKTDE